MWSKLLSFHATSARCWIGSEPQRRARDNEVTRKKPKGFFDALAVQSTSRSYKSGQAIFAQGKNADSMFRIEHGCVKLTTTYTNSTRTAVAILRAGDCFGEDCLFEMSLRRCSATSVQGSIIGRIGKRAVVRRLRAEPTFARLFTRHLLFRIQRVEDDLFDQLVNSSEKRLARLLLRLSDFGNEVGELHVEVMVDQGTLAQVVGTTRSRVSHFMNEFRKQGFIDYKGTLSSLRVHRSLVTFMLSTPATA